MDQATNRQKIIAGALSGVLWLLAIVAMHFFGDVKDALLAFTGVCQSVILLVTGAHIGGASSSNKQGGFSLLPFVGLVAFVALTGAALLSGCTTTTASMYSGLYTQAKAGVQVFDDNSLKTMRDMLCAQPYSAIQRHPELQAGIVTLCGPLTNTASLSAEQVAIMANMYRQLGLQPAAIALPAASAPK